MPAQEKKDVFISYSTKDQEAKNFVKELFDKEGITYFLDEISLELGKDIEESLSNSLDNTNFTVLLVSRNSLYSTWVCLESIQRLEQENLNNQVTFLPVLVDLEVMDLRFPIDMVNHFKQKHLELEKLREEAKKAGLPTKIYNDEIERLEKVIPEVGDIIQKIKNGLSANFADEYRKEKDLYKLISTIKNAKNEENVSANKNGVKGSRQKKYLLYGGIGLLAIIFFIWLLIPDKTKNVEGEKDAINQEVADSVEAVGSQKMKIKLNRQGIIGPKTEASQDNSQQEENTEEATDNAVKNSFYIENLKDKRLQYAIAFLNNDVWYCAGYFTVEPMQAAIQEINGEELYLYVFDQDSIFTEDGDRTFYISKDEEVNDFFISDAYLPQPGSAKNDNYNSHSFEKLLRTSNDTIPYRRVFE